jgi:aromatic ring-opening dioxygenase LigB subunit
MRVVAVSIARRRTAFSLLVLSANSDKHKKCMKRCFITFKCILFLSLLHLKKRCGSLRIKRLKKETNNNYGATIG